MTLFRKGAVLTGGKRAGSEGTFLEPTLLVDLPESVRCYRQEIFAPVAALYRFELNQK